MGLVKIFNVKKITAFISAVVMSAVVTADAFRTEAYNYWNNNYGYGYGYSAEPFNDAALSDTHIEDGNSLSRAMNEAIAANEETAEEGMPVCIHDAVVDRISNTITVDYSSIMGATIVVALYDDECTQMLTSGKAEIEYNESGTVAVAMDSLPQYFYLKAYAVSNVSAEPLSRVYENHYYTQVWQEFFSKTVNDFDPAQVINLDNDPTKNFAALYADTANIMSDGIHNIVVSSDYDNMIFVIENPDEKITGLTMGQKAVIWGTVGEFIITRVSRLDISDDGYYATIYGEKLAPEDVFEHLNYDMSTEGQDFTYEPHENEAVSLDIPEEDLAEIERLVAEYQAQEAQEAEQAQAMFFGNRAAGENKSPFTVTTNAKTYTIVPKKVDPDDKENPPDEEDKPYINRGFEIVKVEADEFKVTFNVSKDKTYKEEDIKIETKGSMTGSLGIDPDFKVRYFLASDKAEAELVTDIKINLIYNAEGEFDFVAKLFTLPSKSIDGFGLINVNGGDVKYHAHANGKININRTYTLIMTLGAYRNESDYAKTISDVKVEPGEDFDSELEIDITIIGGLILNPSVSVTKNTDFASLGLEIEGDVVVEFTAEINLYGKPLGTGEDSDSIKHECSSCISLAAHFKGKLQGKCTLLGEPYPIGSPLEKDWGNFVECYWSNLDASSPQDGECPHKAYKVTFNVKIYESTDICEGATVTYEGVKSGTTGKTDKNGNVSVYLPKGKYAIGKVKDKNGNDLKKVSKGLGSRGKWTIDVGYNRYVTVDILNNANKKTSYGYSTYSMRSYSAPRAAEGVIPADINDMAVVISVGGEGEKIKQFESCNYTYGAVTENGDLYMWGQNTYGQLGNGTTESSSEPVFVMGNVSRFYLFRDSAAAVTTDGKFYSWGEKPVNAYIPDDALDLHIETETCVTPELVSIPGEVVSANLSGERCAVVTADGSVYMWGQIPFVDESITGGMGSSTTFYQYPTRIDIGSYFSYVNSDGTTNLALVTKSGEVYGCSYCTLSSLNGGWSVRFTRVLDNIENVEKIYLSPVNDSFIITKDGSMYRMEKANPKKYKTILHNVTKYARADLGHTALTKDGKVLYWRNGDSFEEAENIKTYSYADNAVSIAGNYGKLGILTSDGKIYISQGENNPPEQVEITKENPEEAVPASYSLPARDMQYYGFYAGAQQETKSFSGLIPNAVYNFYVMQDREADNQYSADNLLYIEQKTSDAGGNLTFVYTPTMTAADTDAFVETAERIDFTGSDFYAYNIEYDGEEHFVETSVFLNGEELQIGRDYALCGNYSVTEPGTYELIFLGQGRYKGAASVTFDVYTGSYVPEPTPDEPLKSVTINGTPITVSKNMTYEIPYSDWNGGNNFTVNAEAGDGCTATVEPSSFTANSADFVQTVTITVSDGITSETYILTVTASGCNHNYGSYLSDGNGHWRECLECGNEEHGAHDSLRSEVTVPPTEYSEGLRTYYCSVCGYAVRTENISATGGNNDFSYNPTPVVTPVITGEKREPFIKNDSSIKGWDAICEVLNDVEDGSAVHIDMNGTDELPKKALTKIKGKDVDLILDMGKGIVWTVNGYSVTKPKKTDMGVNKNSRKIPAEVINSIDGKKHAVQLSLDNKNNFGFTAVMAIDLDTKYNGLYANLFYYDTKAKELVFADCDLIEEGKADIKFMLGSNYAVIISEEPLGEYEDVSSAAGILQRMEQPVMETAAYPLCILVIIIGGIAIIAVKKKNSD